MIYSEFEKWIKATVVKSSEAARRQFAFETIGSLRRACSDAIRDELTAKEQSMLIEVLAGIERDSTREAVAKLSELDESMGSDPVRAIEFFHGLTELLCAAGNWLEYRRTGDANCIFGIAVNMVNFIDYNIAGRDDEYSNGDMLGAVEMRQEYERQQRVLSPPNAHGTPAPGVG
jgi:hypothetical protein